MRAWRHPVVDRLEEIESAKRIEKLANLAAKDRMVNVNLRLATSVACKNGARACFFTELLPGRG